MPALVGAIRRIARLILFAIFPDAMLQYFLIFQKIFYMICSVTLDDEA
jgi:hypothetical protein